MTTRYDTLITTHADGTASLTLYRHATTDVVLEGRLEGHRWREVSGYRTFNTLTDAEIFRTTHIPLHRQGRHWVEPGHARWSF